MLVELRIANLGVIADATLSPSPGMTVVTGETGAGKTMIVTGLGLLLGERADGGIVRRGSSRAVVEGRFTGLDAVTDALDGVGAGLDGDELLVARHVSAQGRSRAFVGGVQAPISHMGAITGELATIHGQSEQLRLGTAERQREVLDRSGGTALANSLTAYREAFARRSALRAEREDIVAHALERAREADLLRFGLDEITHVDPQPGEDEQLATEAARLQAIDDLRMLAERAGHALSGSDEGDPDDPGAVGLAGVARHALDQVAQLDDGARELAGLARSVTGQVNDLAAQVASYLADLDADPLRLEAVTTRRAELASLTRKYGTTIDEVLAWAQEAAARCATLSDSDDRLAHLDAELSRLDGRVAELGQELTDLREQAADRLTRAVQGELAALAMPHARLGFDLRPLPEPGPWGREQIVLLFAANPGAVPAPLAKVASGGELSRVRLALEVVLAAGDPGHVFIFDEVDAGVGGAVAVEVGRRLARLAAHSQVIVVTHLAQVAAFADAHWVVSKSDDGRVTTSDLRCLTDDDREAELARMMGGLADSESGLAHARELLANARDDATPSV
ncbi:DNA repair protein RecN [Brooklawnia cerclae]|uniref:DNA repair protein RecN n=1 Tax=Brooklawnia cerclae TaxID=349934 RepID=A0ABX0SHP0_9ACTN|nr:DNA repair protein RecN [Brooklawnia cerclae]NIH56126.1 DNA repair protein RecN (Recombination protein N) [Brooklawnia cerclae]